MKRLVIFAITLAACAASPAKPALAEVDVRTPWADVYVGPEGVFVHGPWGRVEVPASERDRVCRKWRRSVRKHYQKRRCRVKFDAKGCIIEKLDCEQ